MTGRIMKATAGFYYVKPLEGGEIMQCRARGIFRKNAMSPCVGDIVDVYISKEDNTGSVDKIYPRKNHLIRPPLANIECMLMVVSTTDPQPNFVTIDKLLAILEHKEIPVIIVLTKTDFADAQAVKSIYQKSGYTVFEVNNLTGEGSEQVLDAMQGKLCAFFGNSGVGKSSLINAIAPHFNLEIADTSKKLGRGKHTTRHCEIFELSGGAMIADTPGFSSVDIMAMSDIKAEELDKCFIDFLPFTHKCKFQDCRHMEETGCAVKSAVSCHEILEPRYKSYRAMFDEIKDIKDWQRKS